MIIGFLRNKASLDELAEEMAALEKNGCERIVVDNGPAVSGQEDLLAAVVGRLSDGDSLIVCSLDSVAASMPELIDLALKLEAENVRLRSLREGFDTHGRHRAAIKATFSQLQEFERQLSSRQRSKADGGQLRRVGRPRSLSSESIERARALVKSGVPIEEVASRFQVSRATLYRYLEDVA